MDAGAVPWWKKGVIYQIYVRSFADANGDGIGDLPGIEGRLDYLNGAAGSLGVDAIWLTPFYESPDRDFGYDVSDYRRVSPLHGTMDDFDSLLAAAHERDIRLVCDFVPNHTSDQHAWFRESRSSRDNPKRDWYVWRDGRGNGPPNNWQATPGGRGWEYDARTGQWYYHAFFDFQPDLNWRNPEVKEAVFDDIRFWLDKGVDGFRLDLINYLLEDERFRDNGRSLAGWWMGKLQDTAHTRDLPETHEVLAELRNVLDAYDERMMVGEIVSFPWEDSPAATYTHDRELHLAFNMEMLAVTSFRADRFREVVDRFEERCPEDGWPAYVLSNHDVPRHAGRLGGYAIYGHRRHAMARAKVCAAMLLTLRGTPFLYYGEELGMTNRWFGKDQILDPMGKKIWPLYQGRDASRTPMLWEKGPGAGFSSGTSWLPIDPQADLLCVETTSADPQSLLNFYRTLLAVRRATLALQVGAYEPIGEPDRAVYQYRRQVDDQSIVVALNFSAKPATTPKPVGGTVLAGTTPRRESVSGVHSLNPYEVLVVAE